MHYYKSQELADLYGVSRRTVTNWIKQTQEGKIDLELGEHNGESYIIKSSINQSRLDRIVNERQKYLNTRSRKELTPKKEFYKTYSEEQIYDIIQHLNRHKELPLQYSYFGKGAEIWDYFRSRPEGRFDTPILVEGSKSYLNIALQDFDKVNVIDIGVGNGMAAKEIIGHLKQTNRFNKYIGIDISPDMLQITKANLKSWFGEDIICDTHIKDVTHQLFGDIIAEPMDKKTESHRVANLVLLFGGSISNFKDPSDVLRTINKSMGSEDIFMCHFKLVTPAVMNRLSFISYYQAQCEYLLGLLGIDPSLYQTEIGVDEAERIRYGRIRLNRTIKLNFKLTKGDWQVDLKKNETILTYRAHFNEQFDVPQKLFYKNGFNPLLITKTLNNVGMLILANLKDKT